MAELVVVTRPELADGFRLAGAVAVAGDRETAEQSVTAALETLGAGIVAIHAEIHDGLSPRFVAGLRASSLPIVIRIPSGVPGAPPLHGADDVQALLRRAIGVRLTFAPEGDLE